MILGKRFLDLRKKRLLWLLLEEMERNGKYYVLATIKIFITIDITKNGKIVKRI